MDKFTIEKKIRDFRDSEKYMTQRIYNFLDLIIDDVNQLSKESVTWSFTDFLYRALEKEEYKGVVYELTIDEAADILQKYDLHKFQAGLERMIDKHDATIGITWDTIDFYLDEYCLKK
jgi:hypothetical protein